jgi:hypothetical protein
MVCLILALQWGGSTYSWSAPKIIGLLVTFSVLSIAFVVVEVLTPETAMVPTRVVLSRSTAGSMTFMFLLSGGLMSVVYYLKVWFQVAKDDSAMHVGVSTIPLVLSLVIMSIVAAICMEKIGYYVPAMLFSPVLCSIGHQFAFDPLAKLRAQRLDWLPGSLWLRYWLWLLDFEFARPERFTAR